MSPTVPFSLTQSEVDSRKAYLGITTEDEKRLSTAHPHLQEYADEIIDRFYDHLLFHEHTRRMLSAPGLVERLKKLQASYFVQLTAGRYDLEYFENRLRVGQVHDRVGLSPEWYLGAYNKYLQIVSDVLSRAFVRDYERFFQTLMSLTKVIYLDQSLAIDAYILSAQARLEQKNADLAKSNEELRHLQTTKQQLSDMIVHDLQNPLAGIQAFLQHLADKPDGLDLSERQALDEALRRCRDLSNMVMNVLQISRAEAGKFATYIENVDLVAVTKESAEAFRLVAERERRALTVTADGPLAVRTDQSLLRRILENLIRNALRHTPAGTRITVRAGRTEGGAIRVSVTDEGPGIPIDVQPLLFERFGAPALKAKGLRVDTGLGLAFCKTAADALGLRLHVRSDGVRGTEFSVEF